MRYEIVNNSGQPRRFGGEWVSDGETRTVTMRPMAALLVTKWRRAGVRVSQVADARPEPVVAESEAISHELDPPTRHTWEPREEQEQVIIYGWRDIKDWPELRSLAASVSKHPIRSRADAEAALEAEEARRAGGGATDTGAL